MNGTKRLESIEICYLRLMKSIRTLGKWRCCGENGCFKQEILSRWNTSFMWGSCARSLAERRRVTWLVQERSWGQGRLQYWWKRALLWERLFSSTQGAAVLLHRGDEGSVSRPIKLPELLLHLLQGCPRSVSSPTQAETLLIYSHGLRGHQVSPDDLPVCRRTSYYT